jgi:hypothetical protein
MVWFLPDALLGCVEAEAWDALGRLLDRLRPDMPPEPVIFFTASIGGCRALLALRRDGASPQNRDAARAALAAIVASGATHTFAPLRDHLAAALGTP